MNDAYTNEIKHVSRSEGYGQVTVANFETQLKDLGYDLLSVKTSKATKIKNEGFQKHIARFRNTEGFDGLFPEILIINDHLGRSSLNIKVGLFRLVCTNGLVTGTEFESIKIRHVGNASDKVKETLPLIAAQSKTMIETVNKMRNVELSISAKTELAKMIISEKLQGTVDETVKLDLETNVRRLLNVRRYEDRTNDLFTVMNVIQENLFQAGIKYQRPDKKSQGQMRDAKTRQIVDLSQAYVNTNVIVWDNAVKMIA